MARPRIFISSTFYDLRHIRASLVGFIEDLGYEAITSEKGRIAYDPDQPLDESCYRESAMSDILVLIVGGRYGSAASGENLDDKPEFYDRYESITKKEYLAALKKDIPVYILVDKSVYSEFELFKRNRTNQSIDYAHVDSVNIFLLMESILDQARNNPIHQFESHNEIEIWLKGQWAGLFHELINRRSEKRTLDSLEDGIEELSVVSSSLQRYMETIVTSISKSKTDADRFIGQEKQRTTHELVLLELKNLAVFRIATEHTDLTHDDVMQIVTSATDLDYPLDQIEFRSSNSITFGRNENKGDMLEINKARQLLGLDELKRRPNAE